jgi:hypothetical protein
VAVEEDAEDEAVVKAVEETSNKRKRKRMTSKIRWNIPHSKQMLLNSSLE